MIKAVRTLLGTTPCATIDLRGCTIMRIEMPAAWTASQIGLLEAFDDAATFKPVYNDEGDQVFVEAGTTRMIRLDPAILQHAKFCQLYSVVSQGAGREIVVQVVPLKDIISGGTVGA